MASTTDTLERNIGRLYTNFILRDLTFFVSGAIVLTFAVYGPIEDALEQSIDIDERLIWVVVVVFFALSYVLGVLLQEAIRLVLEPCSKFYIEYRLNEITTTADPKATKRDICKEQFVIDELLDVKIERLIRDRHSERALNGVERVLFLKQIAGTQLSAMVPLLIIFLIRYSCKEITSCWPGLVMLIVGVVCWKTYMKKALQQEKLIWGLYNLGPSDSQDDG